MIKIRELLKPLWVRPDGQMPGLDGLRALAVLLVICAHWADHWVTDRRLTDFGFLRLPVFYWGWTGVDLFFVLSGFLIGQQLWSELGRTGRIDFWRFFLRRGFRIWPLFYVWLTFLLLFHPERRPSWPDWTMLSNYWPTVYGRDWSLATEEHFYLVMPLLLSAIAWALPRGPWRPAAIGALLVAVAAMRAATRAQLTAAGLSGKPLMDAMYGPFHLHNEGLLIGLLVAWVAVERPAWLRPAPEGRLPWRTLGVALAMAVTGVALRQYEREVFAYLALGLVYGGMLIVALVDRSWITAALRHIAMYPVARLSYGMYLNHVMIPGDTSLAIAAGAVFGAGGVAAFWVGLVTITLLSAAMAALTFVLVEQPGLRLRERWVGHARPAKKTAGLQSQPLAP